MKDQSFTDEVMKILDEAPSARRALRENYDNLVNVADYCCNNYIQAGDSSTKALEETKNFATQSLASVAYQISTLASSVLSLLDAQTNQLCRMESSIHLIGQTVEMHKEKVSRREIGTFTSVRRVPRCHKVLPPSGSQPRPPYSRRPINYQQLDGVGHGMKISGKQADRTGTIRKSGASVRSNRPPEPIQCPVAPPAGSSSFGKPVAPPSLPPTWQAPPECDIIPTLLDDAPPPPPTAGEEAAEVNQEFRALAPPPPPSTESSGQNDVAPPPAPPPPPETNHIAPVAPPIAPALALETVEEESCLPAPPPPPPSDDEAFPPPLPSEGADLLAPPPPPPLLQGVEEALLSRRSRRRHSPPASRSLSLRVRSGPASRCRYTRSLFLPTVQSLMIPPPPPYPPPSAPPPPASSSSSSLLARSSSSSPRLCLPARLEHLDLEIPAPPPPLLLDDGTEFDDIMPPLPPPVDYDTSAPPEYLEKVVALYTHEASKPDDLSFTQGDMIYLTRRLDDGWCEGVVDGKRGLFPENLVQSCG